MNPAFPSALPRLCIAALLLTLLASHVNAQTPEHARILAASNRTMSATLTLTPGKPPLEIQDLPAKRTLTLPQLFTITLANGSTLRSSDLHPDGNPTAISNPTEKHLCANSDDLTSGAHFHWCLLVPANGSYMRAQLSIHAGARELPIAQLHLLQFEDLQAHVVGTVKGSPAADDSMYFAFEHPLSVTTVDHGAVDASISRVLPLQANQEVTYSAVIGAYSPGQLRRDFLAYIERERPRPYKPFLNYNTWYDIGYENRYSESGALDRIHAFGTELVEKRHVQLDSFVFDDGWDDPTSFWGFNHDLPDGFTRIAQQAATYNAGIGVWLSPWGGYADQKRERIANGKSLGYEIIASGFALSGPKYFHDFSTICSTMIQKYNVNAFKIDGTGNADRVFPGSVFDSDFDAAIHLIHQIRAEKPGIFMNLSTGTYPSPFWLFYSDTIWRGGDDHDFAGVGSQRQRWITYRDEQTYRNVVRTGPLFPLNSLMLHGMIFAQQAEDLSTDPRDDFPSEVLSFFGSGTQLQEMYVTPSLLTSTDWDILAKAARWSRDHAAILQDIHWIGGDPGKLQVYGWAAWSPHGWIVTLRNPSAQPQTFNLNLAAALELPAQQRRTFTVTQPFAPTLAPMHWHSDQNGALPLQPFEVRIFESARTP
ncbi:MAG: enterotoxin [Acidobacteriaceae bacterium]